METKLPEPLKENPERPPSTTAPSGWSNNGSSEASRTGPPRARSSRRIYWVSGLILLAAAVCFFAWRSGGSGSAEAITVATPRFVNVATAQRASVADTVRIEAEFRPYVEDELRAKVSGFLTNITVDIGDKVKAGQLLAELEVPELQNELDRAVAAQRQAEADHYEAHLAYTRLLKVQQEHPNVTLVPQQELDESDAKDRATQAGINAARAEADKYRTMAKYTKIYAPFDGVITKRNADPGALIQTGTSSDTQSMPLVRVSDNYLLRLDFPVSVPWVKDIHEGDPVDVEVDALDGKIIKGTIKRFTRRVDEDTRKMWTEIEVPNPDLRLVPGMFAVAILKVNQHSNALTIPLQAVSNQAKQPTVLLVDNNGEVQERPVTLGVETPSKWEVLKGLKEGDRVIIGSRSEIKLGQKVEPKPWVEPELSAN
jgi:RND family efflux transporter MFP subunit